MSEPAACDCPTCTEAAARPGMAQVTHVESAATAPPRIRCRSVLLRDLDTLDLEPVGMIFEQRDRTAKVEFFETAAERDPHLSKLRREFESFDKAVSAWHRSALLSAPGEEDFLVR